MDRAEEVLLVEPRDPFPDLVTAKLRLTNSSDCSMYFKVVITSPSRLCVWPYCGIIHARKSITLFMSALRCEYDPCNAPRHLKLMSMVSPDNMTHVERVSREDRNQELMNTTLRSTFEMRV
ncbi:hypothetical protein NQD34_002599, partial [Periophthalmus magnuspinnatus]